MTAKDFRTSVPLMSAGRPGDQPKPHVLIIEARFYEDIADELARGATQELDARGATWRRVQVPGAFEIPAAIRAAIGSMEYPPVRERFNGYVALGCVVRGETSHYDYVCGESARGINDLALRFTVAIGYGILTVETIEQAWERAKVDGRNHGGRAAKAAMDLIELKKSFGLFPRLQE
jgi:6,7-dimethyl-8-ribityllumazine synthase